MANKHPFRLTAGITSLIGPAAAALYETGHFRLFPNAPLLEVWLLAVIACFGVGVGALSIWRGAKATGIVCLLANAAVLTLYAFVGAFFTLGGTR